MKFADQYLAQPSSEKLLLVIGGDYRDPQPDNMQRVGDFGAVPHGLSSLNPYLRAQESMWIRRLKKINSQRCWVTSRQMSLFRSQIFPAAGWGGGRLPRPRLVLD